MKRLIPKNKAYLGYALYGILLTVCLLYIFFPSDAFKHYIVGYARGINPRLLISMEDARPSVPFGVKLVQAGISLKEKPGVQILNVESVTIRPEIWSFLRGKSGYIFNCNAYSGNLKGRLQFSKNGFTPPFSTSIKLNNVRIDDYHYLSALTGRSPRGILSGTIAYRGLTDGTGAANLKILNGSVGLLEPFFNLDSIEFDELLIRLVLKEQKIEISHFRLKGRKIQGTMSGAIRLEKDFLKSLLDLKGSVELLGALVKKDQGRPDAGQFQKKPLKLNFTISGTITYPRLKFHINFRKRVRGVNDQALLHSIQSHCVIINYLYRG